MCAEQGGDHDPGAKGGAARRCRQSRSDQKLCFKSPKGTRKDSEKMSIEAL